MMMKMLRSLILSLSAMLFMLNAQSVWAVDCAEWNLAKDFRMSPNQENPNRDSCGNLGVWHFLQSGDFSHTPQTYTLMPNFSTNSRHDGTSGVHNWTGTEIPDVVVYKTEKDLWNATALAKYIYIHPGWSHLTIVGWRSPINGNVKINGEFASPYASGGGCGDGVKWYIDKGATTLTSGSFPNGSSQNVQQGTNGSSLTNISVQQGEFIYFILDYNTNAMCDATKFDVTISPVTACLDTNGSTQTGIDQCKTNPASCGLFTQVQLDTAKQAGIDLCKTNPASCSLFTQAQLDAVKQACKTNPASCGITDTNGSTQTGIDQCKANPASCGIPVNPDQCKTNPASCGLFTQAQIDTAKQASIAQCKTNPALCGITKIDGISTNAFVSPANKMIAGVLISGGSKRVMVRASSVDGAVDPLLEIVTYPDRKPLGNNDSWATDPAAAELTQKKLAPARATDAATIINLPPGLFTMEITSKNGGSGANVIEVYDMAVFP